MKLRLLVLLFVLKGIGSEAQQPILTLKQQIDLAVARQVIIVEFHKLEELPGFKEQQGRLESAQQKLRSLEEQFCQAKDGKKYHLELENGIWSCQSNVAISH